jgi:hypothetical protein
MNQNLKNLMARPTGNRTPKYSKGVDLNIDIVSVAEDYYIEYALSMEMRAYFQIAHSVNTEKSFAVCKERAIRSLNSKLYEGFLSLIDEAMHSASNEEYKDCMAILSELRAEVTGEKL